MRIAREQEARREISWLCSQGLEWVTLVEQAGAAIRRVVPHERFCFHTVDPATSLFTGGLARNLAGDDAYPRVVHNEYVEEDVNKWAALARLERPAGTLTAATGGRPERSVRYRELLQPEQIAWELRSSLVTSSGFWGTAGIYRSDGERDFDDRETGFLASVSPALGEGFRRSLVAAAATATAPTAADAGPGVVLFEPGGAPAEIAPAAERWLAELRGGDGDGTAALPFQVHAVAARTRGAGDLRGEARARVRAPSGRWLSLDGVALGGGRVAVVLQPARPREVAPLVFDSYGLTERERAIAGHILEGRSTRDIAAALHLSPYTVQDHLKAIFEKAGVRSRRELVARVFYDHHMPRIVAGERPDANGGFAVVSGRL